MLDLPSFHGKTMDGVGMSFGGVLKNRGKLAAVKEFGD